MEWLEALFLSRWGGYIIMLLLLGGIVFFLRFLFGPKGLFRDPAWDRRNQEMREEEERVRQKKQQAWQKQQEVLKSTPRQDTKG